MPNLFYSQVRHWGKVFTGYLLLLNWFCSFLILMLRSPNSHLGDASFNIACYWMQRTIHCMGFVVEWFIGMQWPAFGFGKRWAAWLCLSLCLPIAYCLLFWGGEGCTLFVSPVPSFPDPSTSLEVLSVSFPISPFAILIFPLCFRISLLSPVYHIYFFKFLSSLWIPSPPILYPTQKLQATWKQCDLSHRVLFEEALSFPFLSLGSWQDEQQRAWPLGLVCGFCGSMWTMKYCTRAHANCIATFIKNCQRVSKGLKCFTWYVLMIPKE